MTSSPHDALVRTFPAPLVARLAEVSTAGHGEVAGHAIDHGRLDGQPVTLQVARASTPRLLLGLVPLGDTHWLQVELRSARERLVDWRAPADEALLEGLPWAADTQADTVELGALLSMVAAARGAGVELASWTVAETVAPEDRPRDTTVEAPAQDDEKPVEEKKKSTREQDRRRQIQPPRYLIATCLAFMAAMPWFIAPGGYVSMIGVLVIIATIALVAPFLGPERLLLAVYGPCLLGGIAVGQPWLADSLGPGDGYERVAWPVVDYGPVEFRFADHVDIIRVDAQSGEATVDGERCRVAPIRQRDAAAYGIKTWAACCTATDAGPCMFDAEPNQAVVRRIDQPTVAMEAAIDDAVARHGMGLNGRQVVTLSPGPPEGERGARDFALGFLALIVALGLANGLVYLSPPGAKKKKKA